MTLYNEKKNDELRKLCQRRQLPYRGNKTALIARLQAWDEDPQRVIFNFLQLPAELRNIIYGELLTIKQCRYTSCAREDGFRAFPAIIRANWLIKDEIENMILAINTLEVFVGLRNISIQKPFVNIPCNITLAGRYRLLPGRLDPFSRLPEQLGTCERLHLRIEHCFDAATQKTTFDQNLDNIHTHLTTLMSKALCLQKKLRILYVSFDISASNRQGQHPTADQDMLSFEQRCLQLLGQLRGLQDVHFHGLRCIGPADIDIVKRQIKQPKPVATAIPAN